MPKRSVGFLKLIRYRWWYSPILPIEISFPQACRRTLTSFLLKFSLHLSRKRPEDVLLNVLTNSASIFIVFLGELSKALMAQTAIGKEPADAIALYLTDNPDSSFANVLDRAEQAKKLKAVSEDILQTFLEPAAYQFDPARTFLKEVLAELILEPTLVNCSKAAWINGWIVYLLEQGEPEIMNAINAGVGEATGKQVTIDATKQELPKNGREKDSLIMREGDDQDREALEEVRRLNALIASGQFDERKEGQEAVTSGQAIQAKESEETASSAPSTNHLLTPTSSESDLAGARSSDSLDEPSWNDQFAAESSQENRTEHAPMTSFDQIVSQDQIFVEPAKIVPLTLHQAVVNIFDDSQPGDKSTMRSKPIIDYLLQVEPASSQHPGWMIARKYADFETLHEVLRRISVISGVPEFNSSFPAVPAWKGQTKNALTANLEAYLRGALSHARLAESVGMKRFLEKDEGLEKLGNAKGTLGFPSPEAFQTMGKGVLDVLAGAPKGAAGGGKALLDGMKGVGGVLTGQKRTTSRPNRESRTQSTSTLPNVLDNQSSQVESITDSSKDTETSSISVESSRASVESTKLPKPPVRSSMDVQEPLRSDDTSGSTSRPEIQQESEQVAGAASKGKSTRPLVEAEEEILNLPPRPDEIDSAEVSYQSPNKPMSTESVHGLDLEESVEELAAIQPVTTPKAPTKQIQKAPLSSEETSVAVELIFAVTNELYTLSSAWNIRRTLLNAAKTFLLRPGNPSLEQIRKLLQESVIEANTSDTGIAYQLQKLRENSLPTEAELALWPPPASKEENEKLRKKARKLLVEQGMPPALRGIMGAVASGEALGRLFDSLQVEEASRGLMFAVMLQSVRALTH